jgi:hypothetical protein
MLRPASDTLCRSHQRPDDYGHALRSLGPNSASNESATSDPLPTLRPSIHLQTGAYTFLKHQTSQHPRAPGGESAPDSPRPILRARRMLAAGVFHFRNQFHDSRRLDAVGESPPQSVQPQVRSRPTAPPRRRTAAVGLGNLGNQRGHELRDKAPTGTITACHGWRWARTGRRGSVDKGRRQSKASSTAISISSDSGHWICGPRALSRR